MGKLSDESLKILESRRTNEWKKLEIKPTLLFTRRADVDQINITNLKKCPGPDYVFRTKTVYTPKLGSEKLGVDDPEIKRATERMDKNGPYVGELVLRKGAQVMLIYNVDMARGLVNGSRGIVEDFVDGVDGGEVKIPLVKFKNGETLLMTPTGWESDEMEGLERHQIPLKLAYAVTIHKAQGATLDCALVDIGDSTFEYGQAYVALSRVRSLDCLYIWDLKPNVFLVHPKVKAFLNTVPGAMEASEVALGAGEETVQASSQSMAVSAAAAMSSEAASDDPTCA
jgi:ATP-dependent DNA helicase PIF1